MSKPGGRFDKPSVRIYMEQDELDCWDRVAAEFGFKPTTLLSAAIVRLRKNPELLHACFAGPLISGLVGSGETHPHTSIRPYVHTSGSPSLSSTAPTEDEAFEEGWKHHVGALKAEGKTPGTKGNAKRSWPKLLKARKWAAAEGLRRWKLVIDGKEPGEVQFLPRPERLLRPSCEFLDAHNLPDPDRPVSVDSASAQPSWDQNRARSEREKAARTRARELAQRERGTREDEEPVPGWVRQRMPDKGTQDLFNT